MLAKKRWKLGWKLTIATGDDNVEVLAVLALVGGRIGGDRISVDGALDVGDRGGVCAAWAGLETGVALKEEVEPKAEFLAVAEGGTC